MSDPGPHPPEPEASPPAGGRRRPVVVPTRPGIRLDEPLVAVNLLAARRPRLYALYGLLAYPGLARVGGRPLWKGHRERVLAAGADTGTDAGEPFTGRDTLLLVAYPDAASFLALVGRPWFAALSVLRRLAVRDFRFGFLERLDAAAAERIEGPKGRGWLAVVGPAHGAASPDHGFGKMVFAGRKGAELRLAGGGRAEPRPTRLAPPWPWEMLTLLAGGDAAELAAARPEAAGPVEADAGSPSSSAVFRRDL